MSARRSAIRRVPPFVVLSVLGHGLILLALMALGVGSGFFAIGDRAFEAPEQAQAAEELNVACLAEKLLDTGGRALACLTPGRDGRVDECAASAVRRMETR